MNSALTTTLASRNSLIHIPPGKERCSCGLIDSKLSIYKNGFLIVPFLSMIATSADSFASHVLFISAATFTVYNLLRYQKVLDVVLHLLFYLDAYTWMIPCLLVWLICTSFHSYIRPCTRLSRSLQDFSAGTRIPIRLSHNSIVV